MAEAISSEMGAPMDWATDVQTASGQTASAHVAASRPPPSQAALGEAIVQLRQLQRKIKSECRDVGTDFATEVRKMHYGDSKPENIYGHLRAFALSKAATCRIIDRQRSDWHKPAAKTGSKPDHIIKNNPRYGKFGV